MAEKQTNKERLKDITDSIETGIKELFESDKYRQYLATMTHPARAYGERLLFSSCATVLSQPHFLRDVLRQRSVTQTAQLPQPNEKGGEGHAHCICHLLDLCLSAHTQNGRQVLTPASLALT